MVSFKVCKGFLISCYFIKEAKLKESGGNRITNAKNNNKLKLTYLTPFVLKTVWKVLYFIFVSLDTL
jgi:hypothetical protein